MIHGVMVNRTMTEKTLRQKMTPTRASPMIWRKQAMLASWVLKADEVQPSGKKARGAGRRLDGSEEGAVNVRKVPGTRGTCKGQEEVARNKKKLQGTKRICSCGREVRATGRRYGEATYILIAVRAIRQTDCSACHETDAEHPISKSKQDPMDALYKVLSSAQFLDSRKELG